MVRAALTTEERSLEGEEKSLEKRMSGCKSWGFITLSGGYQFSALRQRLKQSLLGQVLQNGCKKTVGR